MARQGVFRGQPMRWSLGGLWAVLIDLEQLSRGERLSLVALLERAFGFVYRNIAVRGGRLLRSVRGGKWCYRQASASHMA